MVSNNINTSDSNKLILIIQNILGMELDSNMPADISEFETTNQLRLSGIVSARPLPRILYPGCSIFFHKLGIEISFQHDATIYKLLSHHKRKSLKSWVQDRIFQGSHLR